MSARDHSITTQLALDVVLPMAAGDEVIQAVRGELRYELADPFAVTLTISAPGWLPVRWTMARDLLLSGCYEPAGEGDVCVEPCLDDEGRALVLLELRSPFGAATLAAPTADVAAFCHRVVARVPIGTESDHLDVDGVIHRLLQGA